jgi:hypothetical protein
MTTQLISRNIPGKILKNHKNIGLVGDLVKFRTSIFRRMESNTFYSKFCEYHNHLSTKEGNEKKGDKARRQGEKRNCLKSRCKKCSEHVNIANQNRLALEKPANQIHGEDSKKRNETINLIIKRDSHFFGVRRL